MCIIATLLIFCFAYKTDSASENRKKLDKTNLLAIPINSTHPKNHPIPKLVKLRKRSSNSQSVLSSRMSSQEKNFCVDITNETELRKLEIITTVLL